MLSQSPSSTRASNAASSAPAQGRMANLHTARRPSSRRTVTVNALMPSDMNALSLGVQVVTTVGLAAGAAWLLNQEVQLEQVRLPLRGLPSRFA